MEVRQAGWKDIKLDAELTYNKDRISGEKYGLGETVVVRGFSPLFKTPYNQVGIHYDTLCVIQTEDGDIILALEDQLFIKVG